MPNRYTDHYNRVQESGAPTQHPTQNSNLSNRYMSSALPGTNPFLASNARHQTSVPSSVAPIHHPRPQQYYPHETRNTLQNQDHGPHSRLGHFERNSSLATRTDTPPMAAMTPPPPGWTDDFPTARTSNHGQHNGPTLRAPLSRTEQDRHFRQTHGIPDVNVPSTARNHVQRHDLPSITTLDRNLEQIRAHANSGNRNVPGDNERMGPRKDLLFGKSSKSGVGRQ
ncbi:hypothetical protein K435DRAFT_966425 [Dendrothele bispora CBS 962.96]|uniref:Pal1-domain-containing protein n=1 Tax=Dendrothele bispora (strain CBS 962.96) TaxID=1314807 RepID=A0A4S8M0P8_DENBC|nr:hypothetical protein K435DRAFT_966425 [Dendrothele bispora CBS 962.96]